MVKPTRSIASWVTGTLHCSNCGSSGEDVKMAYATILQKHGVRLPRGPRPYCFGCGMFNGWPDQPIESMVRLGTDEIITVEDFQEDLQ